MVNGNVTGTGNLTINGTLPAPYPSGNYNYGAVILAGSGNSWTGQTIITAWTAANQGRSTLVIGNAGPGSLPVGTANAISLGTGASLYFNTTNAITIANATINGGGTIGNWGSGRITLSDDNSGDFGAPASTVLSW